MQVRRSVRAHTSARAPVSDSAAVSARTRPVASPGAPVYIPTIVADGETPLLFHITGTRMPLQDVLSTEQNADILASLQRYAEENLDVEVNELQATLLLDYIMTEIAPFAYNRGVEDARGFISARLDDLSGVCFEDGLRYWEQPGGTRMVRRKPD